MVTMTDIPAIVDWRQVVLLIQCSREESDLDGNR
jgi:hypothetical protein